MKLKTFRFIRILTTIFIAVTIATAIESKNPLLAISVILIGAIFLLLVRRGAETVLIDERMKSIGGQAARLTFSISTIILALLSVMFTTSENRESLGILLSYIVMFNLVIYSLSYNYYNKK